ncbi:MAG TPA: hypothetical protein VD996_02850 [Chitinophagaceae bacterium]|nr:hypothetical protein [Chitinophagaceae bacterium]
MSKERKDLPARSDTNRSVSDKRHQQQEEFDNLGKDEQQKESEVRNTQRNEQMRDSQQGGESKLPETKAKESPATYQENRKLPQIKR